WDVADVVLVVRRQGALEAVAREDARLRRRAGQAGAHAALAGLELSLREGRLAEDLAEQRQRLRQRVPLGLDGECELSGRAGPAAAAAPAAAATEAADSRRDDDAQA